MEEIHHFSHRKHALSLIEVAENVPSPLCNGCKYLIHGPAYTCTRCKFWLHKTCAQLPNEIMEHPLHPQHKLTLYTRLPHSYFICDACRDLNLTFVYHCVLCNFNLDVKCACAPSSLKKNDPGSMVATLKRVGHEHPLAPCNIRKELRISCVACQCPIITDDHHLAYSCNHLELDCQFFLHESCIGIPEVIRKQPFHPQHALHLYIVEKWFRRTCKLCLLAIKGAGFECISCQFFLHVSCAKYRGRPLKHSCHKHDLFYFSAANYLPHETVRPRCEACGDSCTGSFYRCYECDINFHLGCMPLLAGIKFEGHEHPLYLSDSLSKDDSLSCRCCGEERYPEQEAYVCNKCQYVAHVECVASGVEHSFHEHALCFTEAISRDFVPCCNGCSLPINSVASTCLRPGCTFWLHKSCMALPSEIQNTYFHPQHGLKLHLQPPYDSKTFICDGCGDFSKGLCFHCQWCRFDLDVKCGAQQNALNEAPPQGKNVNVKTIANHFFHEHPLFGCNIRSDVGILCLVCLQTISGLAYACCPCHFYIHQSCVNDISVEAHISFYHFHVLLARAMRQTDRATCRVCLIEINGVALSCSESECKFNLHITCLNHPRLQAPLKHKCHQHYIFYFEKSSLPRSPKCKVCGRFICDDSFYRCVECDVNFHLNCIPLPPTVKHKHHWHPLVLMDSYIEYESSEYYCDACEKPRNIKHQVYACKDCLWIAHVECAASQETIMIKSAHWHQLYTTEVEKDNNVLIMCTGCRFPIQDEAYACIDCSFWVHKTCASLFNYSERLSSKGLYSTHYESWKFICFVCRDLSTGFKFSFYEGGISWSLDVKCFDKLKDEFTEESPTVLVLREKMGVTNDNLKEHTLEICNIRKEMEVTCNACQQVLDGPAYACIEYCQIWFHKTCLSDIGKEIRHQFHPGHPLLLQAVEESHNYDKPAKECNACRRSVEHIAFVCGGNGECEFILHLECAKYQTRTLRHKCHQHILHYFGPQSFNRNRNCYECDEECSGSFLCCLDCEFDIHLECIPLPSDVKHRLHLHPLKLIINDKVEDYDSAECYCDMCNTSTTKNPKNQVVYSCQECNYVAHIDCVLSEEQPPEKILAHLVRRLEMD